MTITVEATYEDGVLKPVGPLPLKNREKVQVTVRRALSMADQTHGMIGWSGTAEAFEHLLKESESDFQE